MNKKPYKVDVRRFDALYQYINKYESKEYKISFDKLNINQLPLYITFHYI